MTAPTSPAQAQASSLNPAPTGQPPVRRRVTPAINLRWRRAVRAGDLACVEALLTSHAIDLQHRVGIDGEDPHAALDLAVMSGQPIMVQRILDAGAQVNDASPLGVSALHLAASRAVTEVIPLLLAAGADVNARDNDGLTPLIYAADTGVPLPVTLLLEAGASVNAQDDHGRTALHHLASRLRTRALMDMLLEAGADPLIVDEEGHHAVHALSRLYLGPRTRPVLDRVIAWAQQHCRAWSTFDEQGHLPLHLAVIENVPTAVQAFLDHGVPCNALTTHGQSPMDLALEHQASEAHTVLHTAWVQHERQVFHRELESSVVRPERDKRRL